MLAAITNALPFVCFFALLVILGLGRMFPASAPKSVRLLVSLLFVLVAASHLYLISSENDFAPDTVEHLVPITAFFATAAFVFFALMLVRDIVLGLRAVWRRFTKRSSPQKDRLAHLSLVVVAVLGTALSITGTLTALALPSVEEIELRVARLPTELNGLRIVHVSDLHASPLFPRIRTQAVVYRINALRADVVALTGDFSDGIIERRAWDLEPLAGITARYGVYAVLGNHDYFADPYRLAEILEGAGIRLLDNASRSFPIKGKTVTIAGVSDPTAAKRGMGRPNLTQTLANAPKDDLRILLAHRPSEAQTSSDPRYGVDLQLSGHTHAGQTWGLSVLVAFLNKGWNEGLYRLGDMALYVSPGTALWPGFPMRLGTRNTITLLRLTNGKN